MSVAQTQLEAVIRTPLTLVEPGPVLVPAKPALRGVFHQVAFFVAVPAAVYLVHRAHSHDARVAAAVYGIGMCALYLVSSSYHRLPWGPAARRRMRRADHATIFVMIAAAYTPICLLVLRGGLATGLLIGAWGGALLGVALTVAGVAERVGVDYVLYLALGWLVVPAMPQIASRVSPSVVGLLIGGGILYTIGAAVLGRHWPDPRPRTFGYHEVWHTMVIVAGVCHYLVMLSIISAA